MEIFLVDFENVGSSGLNGLELLEKDDYVYIFGRHLKLFLSKDEVVNKIRKSKTDNIEFYDTHKTADNYLDFQLISFLGYLVGKGEKANYYIISEDKGFDSAVDFWEKRNISIHKQKCIKINSLENNIVKEETSKTIKKEKQNTAEKKESLQNAIKIPERFKKRIREAVKDDIANRNEYNVIYSAMRQCDSKTKLGVFLKEKIGKKRNLAVYNHIKEIFDEFKKEQNTSASN